MLLGSERKLVMLSATGLSPSRVRHSTASPSSTTLVLLSHNPFSRFRLLPFRSPLLRESLLLSFPLATKMFQFARLSLACPWIKQQFERLTYSGISGSTLIFTPRSISSLTTPFLVSGCLGIHRKPFLV
ncbi:hypothetical protein FF1_033840 [Malus domestica]